MHGPGRIAEGHPERAWRCLKSRSWFCSAAFSYILVWDVAKETMSLRACD